MPKYEFDHIHLFCPDPEKSAQFYQKYFGAVLINRQDLGGGKIVYKLDLKGLKLLVSTPANAGDPMGLSHFGIRTDNLEKAVSELKGKGVKFTVEISKIPSKPNFAYSYFEAPEGVSIELQEGSL